MLTKAVRGAIINFVKALLLQTSSYGGVAHLVERLLRMQEVRGSIPLISTKWTLHEHLLFQRQLCCKGVAVMSKQNQRVKVRCALTLWFFVCLYSIGIQYPIIID